MDGPGSGQKLIMYFALGVLVVGGLFLIWSELLAQVKLSG